MKNLLLSISILFFGSLSLAAINPNSFIGQYRIGDCTQSGLTSAIITSEKVGNTQGLQVQLFNQANILSKKTFVALQAHITLSNTYTQVLADGFTITNLLYSANYPQGALLKTVKLGRSASGGRARLIEMNNVGQKYFECVFYK